MGFHGQRGLVGYRPQGIQGDTAAVTECEQRDKSKKQ